MPRRPRRVPDAHGEALSPALALRALGCGGRVLRALGGNANMHWLVGGVRAGGYGHSAERGEGGSEGVGDNVGTGDGSDRAVLRRYGPWRSEEEVTYELQVLERVAALGWTVPRALTSPLRVGRHLWCLFEEVPGRARRPRAEAAMQEDYRRRGRLLARLHADLATLNDLGQRPRWQRREEALGPRSDGPSVEEVIKARVVPEEAAIMLAYAERARARFAAVHAERLPAMVIHGDLIGSNVLYVKGTLSGIIDFDFTHLDHRAADFVWTWRGNHDEFVHGYEEVAPLTDADRALLAPAFWASVLDSVRMELRTKNQPERVSLPGAIEYLQRRSALTGE